MLKSTHSIAVAVALLLVLEITPGNSQSPFAQNCTGTVNPELCTLIESNRLLSLQCPDCSAYQQQIQDFYEKNHYALAWLEAGRATSQAGAMITLLQNAEAEGLETEDYDGPAWGGRAARVTSATAVSPNELAGFDVTLTGSAMRYMSDLCCGRVDPRGLNVHLVVDRRRCNLSELLIRVIHAADVAGALKEIEPHYAGYQRTKAALDYYLALAKEGEGEPISHPRKTVQPGDTYSGIPALAQRLRRLGDLPPGAVVPPQTMVYEGALVQAVKHFQQRHGLNPDGRIDPPTFKELTIPLASRVRQLQLTLERYRWLPADLPSRFIVVNIPEFVLRAYENHHEELSMKVIVGRAFRQHQTPVFQDQMEYLIFRPYWNVPIRIVRKELVPDIEKKSGFLAKNQFELVNVQGQVVTPETISAPILQQLRAGRLDLRQKPGPENSLGLIKFVFPNHYDVYLHGTPEQQLFSRSRRDFSHGCIRVEDPASLARWVLRDDPSWTMERIQSAMNGSKSFRVDLPKPIPVLILYGTALVEENGEVHFFRDIYGQDQKLGSALSGHH